MKYLTLLPLILILWLVIDCKIQTPKMAFPTYLNREFLYLKAEINEWVKY